MWEWGGCEKTESGLPHWSQKCESPGMSSPQCGQALPRNTPQRLQKRAWGRFSVWQLGQGT